MEGGDDHDLSKKIKTNSVDNSLAEMADDDSHVSKKARLDSDSLAVSSWVH